MKICEGQGSPLLLFGQHDPSRSTIRRTGRLETPSMPVSNSAFPAMRCTDYRKVFIPLKVQRTDDVKRTIGFDRSQTSATSGAETN